MGVGVGVGHLGEQVAARLHRALRCARCGERQAPLIALTEGGGGEELAEVALVE